MNPSTNANNVEVQKTHGQFRSLVASLPFCVHEIDLDGNLISMNPTGLRMVNETEESAVYLKPYLDFVAERDKPRISALLDKAFNGEGSTFEFEVMSELPIFYSSCFIPLYDAAGSQQSVLGYTQEITKNKSKEKELKQEKKRLAKQRDAQVTFSKLSYSKKNPAFDIIKNILQISASTLDVARISLWEVVDNTSLSCVALYHRTSGEFEYDINLSADNYPKYFNALSISQVIDASDAHSDPRTSEFSENYLLPLGITSMLDTIVTSGEHFTGVLCSEHIGKKREWQVDEISFSSSASYHIARCLTEERKEQLAFENQEQAQKMHHTQKLESLGLLAGGIAHDFNNILTTIMGNADLALRTLPEHSNATALIESVKKSTVLAAELAQQMLAYSGKSPFTKTPIHINPFIEDMIHLLRISISKNAVIKLNLAESLPVIDVDKTQLRQIIMNLVINASDAISKKSGVIAISTGLMYCDKEYFDSTELSSWKSPTTNQPNSDAYLFIEVSDSGCGINKNSLNQIFDPFFTTKFTGRGLGLAAVLGIIRAHKGTIKVYSEENIGTTFKILLPQSETSANVKLHRITDEDVLTECQFSGTVLIVDDEEIIRSMTRAMLETVGYQVLEAADGLESLSVYKEHQQSIDAVLMDLTMPHMDGEEAFRELRRINKNVKLILCSGFSKHDIQEKFYGKGVAGYLQKPFQMNKMLKLVSETIKLNVLE
ncbi:response regulator [Colwellia sp. 12G3]|uniref:response regulator n=1 Tax=Colwellia sp. 12G3 TaxID=2058299 RepID=UPI0018E381A3|nr:response regulator [Colwellia sp. 12G3]